MDRGYARIMCIAKHQVYLQSDGGKSRHFLFLFCFVQLLDFFRYLLQFLGTVTEDSQRQISGCETGNASVYFRIIINDLPDFFLKFQIDC